MGFFDSFTGGENSVYNNPGQVFGGGLDSTTPAPPPAPPTPLQQLQTQQTDYANQFKSNLPTMQSQLASQLAQASARSTNTGNRQIQSINSARGLGYGGLNKGMKMSNTSNNASNLASGIASGNAGLVNESNALSTQALQTGVGIQTQQQQVQNDIYQQALAQQNANNSIVGGLLQAGVTTGLIVAMA